MHIRILLSLALAVLAAGLAPAAIAQQLFYIHADHLNTPRLVTDGSGTPVWRWDQLEPFGDNLPNEDPDGNTILGHLPLRFPGQYFDKETNTHYNYFRDYDPAIGGYIQSDPIGLKGGINTYSYVRANPLSRRDPTGLWDENPGGDGGVTPGDPAGPCILVQELPMYVLPPFIILPQKCAFCLYRCASLSCPPKVWHLFKFMCTSFGCADTWPPSVPVAEPVS